METILLVDDEQGVLTGQRNLLHLNGFSDIREAQTITAARAALDAERIDLMVLDLTLPDESGQELLREARSRYPWTAVIVVTGAADVMTAVNCMRLGAYDFLVKGSDSSRIPGAVRNALDHQRTRRENELLREAFTRPVPRHPESFREFITLDPAVRRTLVYLEALASLPDPILISGETGVGKELIARGVHRASNRDGTFVAVNMGGLDDHVFSDTLFGHRKGAFTGADQARDGLITTAAGGTLFLDEIGEMPMESQARLLRLLDSGEFLRLGSDRPEYSRARVICATNRDLEAAVEEGRFRRDLFFRIATHSVHVAPLRERPEDIAAIARMLIETHAKRLDRPAIKLTEEVIMTLREMPLAGNVRELQQIVLRALMSGQWSDAIPGIPAQEPVSVRSPRDEGLTPRQPSALAEQPEDSELAAERPVSFGDTLPTPEEATPGHASRGESEELRDHPVNFGSNLPTPEEAIELLLLEADRRHPESRAAAAAAIGLSPQAFANRWKRMIREEE
jgi:DNA-binding NtrC family response regulator